MEIKTINDQFVGVQGDEIVVAIPRFHMTPDEALRHAAWLVAMAEHRASNSFDEVLEAVMNT